MLQPSVEAAESTQATMPGIEETTGEGTPQNRGRKHDSGLSAVTPARHRSNRLALSIRSRPRGQEAWELVSLHLPPQIQSFSPKLARHQKGRAAGKPAERGNSPDKSFSFYLTLHI